MITSSSWPTHVALVARRLNLAGYGPSGDTFLYTSYLAEVAVKTMAAALYAGLRSSSPQDAYRIGYYLMQADGLGTWDTAIRQCITQPLAGLMPDELLPLIVWATKKRTNKPEDDWFREAKEALTSIFEALSSEEQTTEKIICARDLITGLVRIRNKTKAHGAVGQDFFLVANTPYIHAVNAVISSCPIFKWDWLSVHFLDRETRCISLIGNDPQPMVNSRPIQFQGETTGIYVLPEGASRAFSCSDLIKANSECTDFLFPNGGFSPQGQAEFLDYASGGTSKVTVSGFSTPPPSLPSSETEGLGALDVQSNVFGNLPSVPKGYVERKNLQDQLEKRLLDRNHSIITLHGRGGVGKTSLALFVAHKLASGPSPRFDQIIWFSARDIDLRPSGPSRVRPAVLDLKAISQAYGKLFGVDMGPGEFAKELQASDKNPTTNGTLFIFDNFETLTDVSGIHEFLDTYTLLPNKVLITSRERAFKADYPIAVRGMEFGEAITMLQSLARDLHIEGLVTQKVIQDIFDYAEGHAYVMRVLIGEIAKEGRYVPAPQVMTKRLDIIDAVFERSFSKLTDPGRYVFLTVSTWKSAVSEQALLVVLGQHGIDVQSGLDECTRLSLITEDIFPDGQACYHAPQLARLFGKKKLEGDPDRLLIQEDLDTIRRFGVMDIQQRGGQAQEEPLRRFTEWCMSSESKDAQQVERLDGILESIADLWPHAWLDLAAFRRKHNCDPKKVEYAFHRAVEEMPFEKEVWLERAKYARVVNDETMRITSLVSAVDADPADVTLVSEVAFQLCKYINDRKADIPRARRGIYLASVRSHMQRLADQLDATGLSRLAWLFLLEDDKDNAWQYASLGYAKDESNEYCENIIYKLERDGYRSRQGQ